MPMSALFLTIMLHSGLLLVSRAARTTPKCTPRERGGRMFLRAFDYDKADRSFCNFILATHFTIEQPLGNDASKLPQFFSSSSAFAQDWMPRFSSIFHWMLLLSFAAFTYAIGHWQCIDGNLKMNDSDETNTSDWAAKEKSNKQINYVDSNEW